MFPSPLWLSRAMARTPPYSLPFPSLSLDSPAPARLVPSFEALPPELIEQIALQLCRQTPYGPPTPLLNLLGVSRALYDVLGRNEGFLGDLFKERFDWKSVQRRWKIMRDIEDKREKRELLLQVTPTKADEDLVLSAESSFTRSNSPHPADYAPSSSSPWRPLTSKDLALEFKRRNTVLTRMRRAVMSGVIPPSSSRPNTPRASSPKLGPLTTPTSFKLAIAEPDELTQNLWTCYLMLLENGASPCLLRPHSNLIHFSRFQTARISSTWSSTDYCERT